MKILNIILGIMFLIFAYLQFNDPDPIHWILIYLALSVTCFLAAFGYYYPMVIGGLMIILGAYSIIFIPGLRQWLAQDNKAALFDEIAKMDHLYIEESREFLGLMICEAILLMQLIRSRKIKRKRLI